jgi:hypothetical protein
MTRGEPGVAERGSGPRRRGMTCLASSWKACGHVVRIRRAFVYRRVAGKAVGGSPHKNISYVAVSAKHIDVGTGQRELRRCGVIKCRACPTCGRMTNAAILWKSCGHMVWIGNAVEIRQVAGDARGREPGEHVVFMTLDTRRDLDMSACQGEGRIGVVERRAQPICR